MSFTCLHAFFLLCLSLPLEKEGRGQDPGGGGGGGGGGRNSGVIVGTGLLPRRTGGAMPAQLFAFVYSLVVFGVEFGRGLPSSYRATAKLPHHLPLP